MLQQVEGAAMASRPDRVHKKTDAEHAAIIRALSVMDVFKNVDDGMPTSYVRMFLQVCAEPGKGVTKYAEDLGVYQAVGSRILLEIGPKSRSGGEGLGLVQADFDTEDMRVKNYWPTSKGWRVVQQLKNSLIVPSEGLED